MEVMEGREGGAAVIWHASAAARRRARDAAARKWVRRSGRAERASGHGGAWDEWDKESVDTLGRVISVRVHPDETGACTISLLFFFI